MTSSKNNKQWVVTISFALIIDCNRCSASQARKKAQAVVDQIEKYIARIIKKIPKVLGADTFLIDSHPYTENKGN